MEALARLLALDLPTTQACNQYPQPQALNTPQISNWPRLCPE